MYKSERLVSYSDAIFSIALTLLVIEIRLPEHLEAGLVSALVESWPQFLSFIISFLIITVVWFNHHEMFHNIQYVDYRLIIFNTLLMLNIVLIPFVASILGHSFVLTNDDSKLGCMLYGMWISLGGIPFNLLWNHASKNQELLQKNVDYGLAQALRRHYWKGPVLYLIAALFALVNIWLSVAMYVMLIVMYFLPGAILKKRRTGRKKAATIDIHPAGPGEVEVLLQMWKRKARELVEAGKPMWNLDQFSVAGLKEKYLDPHYFIAYKGGVPFGGFILLDQDERYWPGKQDAAFYFHKFVVDSAFRGQGLGREILEWVKAHGAASGKDFIRLDFEEDRTYLRDLYYSSGFVKMGTVDISGMDITVAECRLSRA